MESKAKVFGHPIHQMLIVFPLGLLVAAFLFDAVYMGTKNPVFAMVGFWNVVGGLVGGLAAAVFGFIDWLAIPRNTRAKTVGAMHGILNVVVVIFFAVSLGSRMAVSPYAPPLGAFLLEAAAVVFGALSGWLGGELVDRLGVGVDDGAHLNAPNSLSGKPADYNAAPPAGTVRTRPERETLQTLKR